MNKLNSTLALIQALPEDLQKQILQLFGQWALQKGIDINKLLSNPDALEEALTMFMQELQLQQLQVQAAKKGAKLNYLKSLKHKCEDDEEPYYFKKGGSLGCGCRKKKEDGGKVEKDLKGNVIQLFKNRTKEEQRKIDKQSADDYDGGMEKKPTTREDSIMAKAYERLNKINEYKDKIKKYTNKITKHLVGGYIDYGSNQTFHNVGNQLGEELEKTGWVADVLPVIGTLKSARMNGLTNPNTLGRLALDVAGLGAVGSVIKAQSKANRILKALTDRGYKQITTEPTNFVKISPTQYGYKVASKTIPNVDYTSVALQPLLLSNRILTLDSE